MQFNHITLLGNIVSAPQLKTIKEDMAVCEFRLAVNNPQNKDKPLFIDVDAWGGLGATVHQYKQKGDAVLVSGKVAYSEWVDPDGNKGSKHHVVANEVIFMPKKTGTSE